MQQSSPVAPSRLASWLAFGAFVACGLFHAWGVWVVGWQNKTLPGVEFRQAQTALSAYWIKADNDFSLAYPTPVLGKPWAIPMEFPLYQWTVVLTSKATHWGLTKAGRAVSIICFYLCLPAVFLLLDRWSVAAGRRWLVLALLMSSPLYVFYSRAFLMETMALMFGLWFWVAYERGVAARSPGWLVLAIIVGVGASLVKVTTFLLYALPACIWSLQRLWAARHRNWQSELAWMAGAAALPLAAGIWWVHYTDAIKALNPMAYFLSSQSLREWNLGTTQMRLSPDLWRLKGLLVRDSLTSMSAVVICGWCFLLTDRRRWKEITFCLLLFVVVLVIFPMLYAVHEYYYVANTVFLLLAMGLALVSLAESRAAGWILGLTLATVTGFQGWGYAEHYYPQQHYYIQGGNGVTQALNTFTRPREVIVTVGQDWSSIIPYFAQRRALMLLEVMETNHALIDKALHELEGETIGALVIRGDLVRQQWLIDRLATLGLERSPLITWFDNALFFRTERRMELMQRLQVERLDHVQLAPGVELPPVILLTDWHEYAGLTSRQQGLFDSVEPRPTRFFSGFGLWVTHTEGVPKLGVHPVTRFVFSLAAGTHTLRSFLFMPFDAYRMDLPDDKATDGVEVTLARVKADGTREKLYTRFFDPRHHRDDRGKERPLVIDFVLPTDGEVELSFGPGDRNLFTRDWLQLGPLKID